MTIDERLERLTERHEALAQALELMQRIWQDQSAEDRIALRELRAAVQGLQTTVQGMQTTVQSMQTTVQGMQTAVQQDAENIRALAHIAEIHERRLSRLEGDSEEENGR
jgi:uncharacterized protein YlxW (UPF0749 family)